MSGDLEVLDTRSGEYYRWDPYGRAWGMDLASEGYVRLEDASAEQLALAVPGLLRRVDQLERELFNLRESTQQGESQ